MAFPLTSIFGLTIYSIMFCFTLLFSPKSSSPSSIFNREYYHSNEKHRTFRKRFLIPCLTGKEPHIGAEYLLQCLFCSLVQCFYMTLYFSTVFSLIFNSSSCFYQLFPLFYPVPAQIDELFCPLLHAFHQAFHFRASLITSPFFWLQELQSPNRIFIPNQMIAYQRNPLHCLISILLKTPLNFLSQFLQFFSIEVLFIF